jgi:hypothetical protein
MTTPSTKVASAAMIGYGTKIEIETVAGTLVYTELAEVKAANKPSATTDQVEITTMSSPDTTKEFISGLADRGEIALTMNWVPGGTTDLFFETWREGGNERRYVKITTPNSKIYTFQAFILDYTGSIPVGDAMEAEVSLKVAGSVTRS